MDRGKFSLVDDMPDTPSPRSTSPGKPSPAKIQGTERDMGSALRSVWQRTVEESVPSDMLDLLGKLD